MTDPISNTRLPVEDINDDEDARSEASTFCERNDHDEDTKSEASTICETNDHISSPQSNTTSFGHSPPFSQDLTKILTAHLNTLFNFPAASESLVGREKLKFVTVLAEYGKDMSVEDFDSLLEYIIRFATFERNVLGKI